MRERRVRTNFLPRYLTFLEFHPFLPSALLLLFYRFAFVYPYTHETLATRTFPSFRQWINFYHCSHVTTNLLENKEKNYLQLSNIHSRITESNRSRETTVFERVVSRLPLFSLSLSIASSRAGHDNARKHAEGCNTAKRNKSWRVVSSGTTI